MVEPCTFVIFGSTGNLARIKLMPALYHLEEAGRLPEGMVVLAFGRRPWDSERWRTEVAGMLKEAVRGGVKQEIYERFTQRLQYFQGDLGDADSYQRLRQTLETPGYPGNAVFYMAIRPAEFGVVSDHLAAVGLQEERSGWRRLGSAWLGRR